MARLIPVTCADGTTSWVLQTPEALNTHQHIPTTTTTTTTATPPTTASTTPTSSPVAMTQIYAMPSRHPTTATAVLPSAAAVCPPAYMPHPQTPMVAAASAGQPAMALPQSVMPLIPVQAAPQVQQVPQPQVQVQVQVQHKVAPARVVVPMQGSNSCNAGVPACASVYGAVPWPPASPLPAREDTGSSDTASFFGSPESCATTECTDVLVTPLSTPKHATRHAAMPPPPHAAAQWMPQQPQQQQQQQQQQHVVPTTPAAAPAVPVGPHAFFQPVACPVSASSAMPAREDTNGSVASTESSVGDASEAVYSRTNSRVSRRESTRTLKADASAAASEAGSADDKQPSQYSVHDPLSVLKRPLSEVTREMLSESATDASLVEVWAGIADALPNPLNGCSLLSRRTNLYGAKRLVKRVGRACFGVAEQGVSLADEDTFHEQLREVTAAVTTAGFLFNSKVVPVKYSLALARTLLRGPCVVQMAQAASKFASIIRPRVSTGDSQKLADLFDQAAARAIDTRSIEILRETQMSLVRLSQECSPASSRTVHVKGIDTQVSEGELLRLLRSCGDVVRLRLCGDRSAPTLAGFFLFRTTEEAQKLMALNGTELGGHKLGMYPATSAVRDNRRTGLQGMRGDRAIGATDLPVTPWSL